MRHRAPRPVLDALTRRPSPRTVRRTGLAAAAVSAGAAGVLLIPGAQAPGSPDGVTVATPAPSGTVSFSTFREDRPGRGASRSAVAGSPGGPSAPARTVRPDASASSSRPAVDPTRPAPSRPEQPEDAPSSPTTPSSEGPTPSASASQDAEPPETEARTVAAAAGIWNVVATASEPSDFECSLDEGPFQECGASITFSGLPPGKHTLAVRATNEAGVTDPTPAVLAETVSGRAP